MPTEGETKRCSRPGCDGTMTYKAKVPPGWGAGTAADGGHVVWGADEQPGWECDAPNRNHFDPGETKLRQRPREGRGRA
jgi:hypothetical protein